MKLSKEKAEELSNKIIKLINEFYEGDDSVKIIGAISIYQNKENGDGHCDLLSFKENCLNKHELVYSTAYCMKSLSNYIDFE